MQEERLLLHRLGSGLATSFLRLADAVERGEAENPALWWADFVAGALNNMLLRDPTPFEERQSIFPFARPHEVKASTFQVPNSGQGGRGSVDLLFQLWLDTETAKCALGTPLIFRKVDGSVPVPLPVWSDLRESAKAVADWAPSTRIVLCGHPDPFAYPPTAYVQNERIYAMPAALCAGYTAPPRGMSGVRAESLGHDLGSGWIGDPALGGAQEHIFQRFLTDFEVQCIVRLHVTKPA